MDKRQKRLVGEYRTRRVLDLARESGVEVQTFSRSHLRLNSRVDYWPTTGKVWVIGDPSSFPAEPDRAVSLARG